ncbi:Ycf48-like protein precursor [Botrimarina colliarenosi]|uniref:Ycf48-like protein n=1 Tax=Botrimarina colliarenosi TaxID=2528001 RepID=A0A5C6AKK9_9BACT|nr:YCF48-related protein [Botrimarina colliarenosi]TWT99798.1 Ycf48-like protein precursor [Botrimarina colliarenosi]
MRRLLLLFAIVASHAPAADGPPSLADVLADDASLRGVAFVDADHGWAVGDRGVVLQTTDAGDHWRRLSTPTDDGLDAVTFADANHGWAVGGSARPYTHESRGVVLATANGGRTWESIAEGQLPRLRAVRFFDNEHGVAAGDGTALAPSGLFTTDDGGRHWRPVPAAAQQQWRAGAFTRDRVGELAGVVAGLRGASARLTGREVTASLGAGDRRGGYGVALVDESRGWLVGDGALVRTTDDGGQAWGPPPSDLPPSLADWFDWRAVACRGEHVWIAGSPGSIVLHSPDAGRTWRLARTGVATPITAITFVDDARGWAVGEFGRILTTRDGGRTWRDQRAGERRSAAAFVMAEPDKLPTELLAINAAGEGFRTVVASPLLAERSADATPTANRLADAATLVGADAVRLGWSTPLEAADAALPPDALLERLNRVTDGRARELLVAEFRKLLVTYRPDVIVTADPERALSGAASLLADAAAEAMELAAQTPPVETGLASWRAERVVGYAIDDGAPLAAGESRQSTGDFSSLLGATSAQWRHAARGLLDKEDTTAPAAYRWRTLAGKPAPSTHRPDLMAGFAHPRGGDARRPAAVAPASQLEQLRRLASKRRNLERLLDQSVGDPAWAGQVVNLTGGLDAESGADLLRQLAEGYRQAGRLELASDTLYLLARRYPDAPLADASLLWLLQYYASGERARADSRAVAGQDARPDTLANVPSNPGGVAQLAAPDKTGVLTSEERLERAAALAQFLGQARPSLYAQPAIRFAEAATQRARGFGADADRTALVLSKQSIADDWRRAAQAERWIAKPEGLPPDKPLANCRYAARRPKLDGRFDDLAWSGADAITLSLPGAAKSTATVRIAHDEEFLFLAIDAASDSIEPIDANATRPRDADLTGHDRLHLRIDTDRDYVTAFELTIDARGWTHDGLWNDDHWRPTWWVAADADESSWRAEAAIPLAELADPEHIARAAWAVSLRRERPGQTPTSWPATAAAADSPDAYGLWLFD